MLKTYREDLLLRTCTCDMQGRWRPSAILEAMQETAGTHAQLLGCGRDQLLKDNIVWVISRAEILMHRYPLIGERVTVETFPMPGRHGFYPRYYRFTGLDGTELGCAGTLWVLLERAERHMVVSQAVASTLPDNADLVPPLPLPRTVPHPAGEERRMARMPAYTDLDVNGHVNNTRYADWLCDALGAALLSRRCLRRLHINYAAEIRPEQEMELRLVESGDAFYFSGTHGGKQHFEAGGEFMDWTLSDS